MHGKWQPITAAQSTPEVYGSTNFTSTSAAVMATHVRGPSASASRVGLHCIQQTMPRAPHSQTGFLT